jgi:hypothetical protein
MPHTLGTAAHTVGVSKSTLRRAIERGRLSASRRDDGSYEIDPAELARVFPRNSAATPEMARHDTGNDTGGLRVEVEMLRERLADKDATIDDLRRRLDAEAEERRRLTMLLTDQRPRGFWQRLRGK